MLVTVHVFHMTPVTVRVIVLAIVRVFVIVHVTVLVIAPVYLEDSDRSTNESDVSKGKHFRLAFQSLPWLR